MSQLTNLDVERVDAVDRPANETRFLVVKSIGDLPAFQVDDQDELLANTQQLAQKAQHLIGHLAESGWTAKSEGAAQTANELAKLVGFDEIGFEVVQKSILNPEEDDDVEVPEGSTPNVEKALAQLVRLQQGQYRLVQQLPAAICKGLGEAMPRQPEPRAPGRSAAINGQDAVRKSETPEFGSGLFADVFGLGG